MTRYSVLLIVFWVMLLAGGCGKEPTGTSIRQGTLILQFEFQEGTPRDTGNLSPSKLRVDSLSIEISGTGMDTIERIFPVEDGVAEGTIENIPAGEDRAVYALAWSGDPTVDLYEGSDTVAIETGRVTEAMLIMTRLRDDVVAHLSLEPESTFVNMPVIADASGSYDYYLPDSLLLYRFLLDGAERRPWAPVAMDTLFLTTKGVHTVTAEVKNTEGTVGQADAMLAVLNRPPVAPTGPSPGIGDTVTTVTPVLGWSATDPDEDDLIFTIWIGDDSAAVIMEETPAQMLESEAESVQVGTLLPETTYYWKVVALDDESNVEGDLWWFFVPPVPFEIDPDSVLLACDVDEEIVTLYNLTAGAVNWSATWAAEWLEVTPSSGTLARTPQPVMFSVTGRSGYEPGFLNDQVTFTTGGFTVDVFAQLEIAPDLAQPLPDCIVLTEPDFRDSVLLDNAGCGDLTWEVAAIQGDWLSASPASGIVGEEEEALVTVVADTSGLSPGSYTGRIDFDIVGSTHSVSIILELPEAAHLVIEPDSLHLGPDIFSAACSLHNSGNVSVDWNAQWVESWLTVTPDNGTLNPNQGAEIEIDADAASLPSGVAEIVVGFSGGETPATLNLSVEVSGEPTILVAPRQVSFPADTNSAGFQIHNIGTGNLSWYVADQPDWCQAIPSSGIVPEEEYGTASLWVDRDDLTPGTYPGALTISSNGGDDVLQMTLEVGVVGCGDPVYYEDFNAGDAPGWQPDPGAGSWNVQGGRYVVSGILPDSLAWTEHAVSLGDPSMVQADARFPAPPIESGIVAVYFEIASGYVLLIDGRNCDIVGTGLKWDGYVFMIAREIVTGEWFAFGVIQDVDLFFPDGWNAIAIAIDNSHFHAIVNGTAEVSVPHVGGTPPIESIGLLASELDMARFDRIYVCPEEVRVNQEEVWRSCSAVMQPR
jgi:hypothetical protein